MIKITAPGFRGWISDGKASPMEIQHMRHWPVYRVIEHCEMMGWKYDIAVKSQDEKPSTPLDRSQ